MKKIARKTIKNRFRDFEKFAPEVNASRSHIRDIRLGPHSRRKIMRREWSLFFWKKNLQNSRKKRNFRMYEVMKKRFLFSGWK